MTGQQDPKSKLAEGPEGNPAESAKTDETASEPKPAGDEPGAPDGTELAGSGGNDGKLGATVNRHKYERDLEAKDREIEELKAQIAEAAETKEGRAALERKVEDLKAQMASEKVSHQLELAGCVNAKAALAVLDDYEGDVSKLKEACPYLFGKDKKTGSTGVKPEGAAKDDDAELDRAFGLKKQ